MVESMAEWIDRQPWPADVKVEGHRMGDGTCMSRALWQDWLDCNHPGLKLAERSNNGSR